MMQKQDTTRMARSVKRSALLGLVVLAAVAACDDDDDTPTAPPPAATRTVNLAAQGTPSSNVTGVATIQDVTGANSTVNVSLTGAGLLANVQHAGQIRTGTCAAPGAVRHTLASTAAGNPAGSATSTNTNNVPDTALAPGGVIVFHATTATTSAIIACGTL